jgi:hypothetical protein
LPASVPLRLLPRSLGHPRRATTLASLHRTHPGHEEADQRLHALRPGLLTCAPSRLAWAPLLPESLARDPPLPTPPQKAVRARLHCPSGPYGHRLYRWQHGGPQHRVNHACGHRPCPQCPQHNTQLWLQHPLHKHLPGPDFLLTLTVPETLRHFLRAPPLRLMRLTRHPRPCQPPALATPPPRVASCPTGEKPMPLGLRLGPSNRALLDTG